MISIDFLEVDQDTYAMAQLSSGDKFIAHECVVVVVVVVVVDELKE